MNNIFELVVLIIIAQCVAGAVGFWIGRNTKPWRKTRYFIDDNGWLVRWKHSVNGSYVLMGSNFLFSKRNLNFLLINCQEINPLKAYQMFPNAFKKNKTN